MKGNSYMKMLKEVQREIQESQLENEKQEYLRQLDLLNTNRITKGIIEKMQGESIEKIYYQIAKEELKHTSNSFFPGDIVILYPTLKEQSSKKVITCDFSGAIIYPKSLYINYRPLLENISKHTTYVLEKP